ncbi:hypothetical protein [Pseudomonas sp. C9-3]|uniref:hypothetical protein n=1 Tax=Pseudomonas sp. C9-3 TaxID=3078264 RepID=UPI0028E5CCD7|nr:hypothetical protein [Pseudomonas sp. C9-3]
MNYNKEKQNKTSFFYIEEDGGLRGVKAWPAAARWIVSPFMGLISIAMFFAFTSPLLTILKIDREGDFYLYAIQPVLAILNQFFCVSIVAATAPSKRTAAAVVTASMFVGVVYNVTKAQGTWMMTLPSLLGSVLGVIWVMSFKHKKGPEKCLQRHELGRRE